MAFAPDFSPLLETAMKPSRTCLAGVPLAVAAFWLPAAALHAQAAPQTQSGSRNEAQKEPGTAPNQKQTKPGNDGANTAGQTPSNPNMPAASPGERAPQPIQGQGTVEGSRANPPSDGSQPGGRAGSGGHKSNQMGR